jgi:hypothetical protein
VAILEVREAPVAVVALACLPPAQSPHPRWLDRILPDVRFGHS